MSGEVKLESSGKTLIILIPALLLFYILFQDIVILYATIIVITVILCVYISAYGKARWLARNLKVKPESVSLRLVAGDVGRVKVEFEAPKQIRLLVNHPLKFCAVKPHQTQTNSQITLEFKPKLAGSYSSDEIYVECRTALNMFNVKVGIPFKSEVTVIPRVIPAVVRALELIASASHAGPMYEYPLIHRIGRGTEYAETREYVAGDEFRRIDWKATARLQKLMVKCFHEEVGGEVNLIFDLKTAGPVSADITATEFLNMATALSTQNIPYRITIINAEDEVETLKFDDWREALATAVKYALKSVKLDYTYLYEIIGPQPTRELMKLMKIAYEEDASNPANGEIGGGWMDAIAITCLIGDLTWLINIWDEVKKHGGRLTVHTTSKVWIDSESLEEAYINHQRQKRILKMLRERGIEVNVH
jgi:hypothetical protein